MDKKKAPEFFFFFALLDITAARWSETRETRLPDAPYDERKTAHAHQITISWLIISRKESTIRKIYSGPLRIFSTWVYFCFTCSRDAKMCVNCNYCGFVYIYLYMCVFFILGGTRSAMRDNFDILQVAVMRGTDATWLERRANVSEQCAGEYCLRSKPS